MQQSNGRGHCSGVYSFEEISTIEFWIKNLSGASKVFSFDIFIHFLGVYVFSFKYS